MAWPDSADTLPTFTDGATPTDATPSAVLTATEMTSIVSSLAAVMAELGLTPSAAFATVAARLAALDATVAAKADAAATSAALALKADVASPALTGNPTAPTQAPGNDTTRIATTAFVEARASVIDGGTA